MIKSSITAAKQKPKSVPTLRARIGTQTALSTQAASDNATSTPTVVCVPAVTLAGNKRDLIATRSPHSPDRGEKRETPPRPSAATGRPASGGARSQNARSQLGRKGQRGSCASAASSAGGAALAATSATRRSARRCVNTLPRVNAVSCSASRHVTSARAPPCRPPRSPAAARTSRARRPPDGTPAAHVVERRQERARPAPGWHGGHALERLLHGAGV
ncbi:hypothetical protein FGB62_189g032 [Gracilaria domingensis]|nr:hypothetical protein FGB62_189g032 [Gracilaria domingensis]